MFVDLLGGGPWGGVLPGLLLHKQKLIAAVASMAAIAGSSTTARTLRVLSLLFPADGLQIIV